jgi:hypothetical protein
LAKNFASVLIDTYNHERFIEQAINSVLEQDFPVSDREIIVVDDGSTDRTPEIARKFGPRIRLLRKENGGQASAFNAGIPECRGEIIAFLDGDDWWAPKKLSAVAEALATDASVGLVGHGITEVFSDGSQHAQLIKDTPRFRIDSEAGALAFRLRKSFLGTSRMTCRAAVLRQIGKVPEALTIQADEYLFTLAGVFSDVLILRDSQTFYRLHETNAFQVSSGSTRALRRKQHVMEAVAKSVAARFAGEKISERVARIVLESIETEAELIRLSLDMGFPWETVATELRNQRIMHPDTSIPRWLFKCLGLVLACVMPSRTYYSLRASFSKNKMYRKAREKWLPFPQSAHVDDYRTTRP